MNKLMILLMLLMGCASQGSSGLTPFPDHSAVTLTLDHHSVSASETNWSLAYTLTSSSNEIAYTYGTVYTIERYTNNTWTPVDLGLLFIMPLYSLTAQTPYTNTIESRYFSEPLLPGSYRVAKRIATESENSDPFDVYAYFSVE